MIYWDTSYIARLFVQDTGWQKVQQLAATDRIACSSHGRVEAVAAFHRKLREGSLTLAEFSAVLGLFDHECKSGAFQWFAVTSSIADRTHKTYSTLPSTIALRGSDALHLGCAAENGFKEIYSNDTRLLNAASHFGLRGLNLI